MIIEHFKDSDAHDAAELEKKVFSDPWSEKSFSECSSNPSDIYLAVRCDGVLTGYCGMWCVAGEGQITNVCVHPDYRKQGIAFNMLSRLIAEGKEKGCSAFTLEVRVSNESAIRLYEKLGFKSAGIRKKFYSHPDEDAMIMWLYT